MRILSKSFAALASAVDRRVGWHRLPLYPGLFTLLGVRNRLRERNLYDTGLVDPPPSPPADLRFRTVDGSYNDLVRPAMGSRLARFGRNIPLHRTFPETPPGLLEPNPRRVSLQLLTRKEFIPARTVNVLAAAWLQFEVHDWLSHETDKRAKPFELPLAEGDQWPISPMEIERTERDPRSESEGLPPTFPSYDSHWWDGSQVYGNTQEFADKARAPGGLLRLEDGLPPECLDPYLDPPGIRGNFWVGLALLHSVFTLEHNAICEELRKREGRNWSDDELHGTARLVNAAVMAKIHTVEWTPAVVAHPTTVRGMHATWYGLVGERRARYLGRFRRSDVVCGIPGSTTDHHGAPYSLTEEFVAVYRMHPLIPDDYVFTSVDDGELATWTFPDLAMGRWRQRLRELGVANALYSFGNAYAGAIKLNNYPRFLQEFRPSSEEPPLDLAAVDILRIRERGVPRYNEFRELFNRKRVRSFEELTGDPVAARELEEIYSDIDRLDLMIGLYAEPVPDGFAFSDTAFRVFLLMASRRLKSDRFFTTDYTPAVYTQTGLDWIDDTTMVTMLERHYPELRPALRGVENAFKPWREQAEARRRA